MNAELAGELEAHGIFDPDRHFTDGGTLLVASLLGYSAVVGIRGSDEWRVYADLVCDAVATRRAEFVDYFERVEKRRARRGVAGVASAEQMVGMLDGLSAEALYVALHEMSLQLHQGLRTKITQRMRDRATA